MSKYTLDETDTTGYFLPEDSQFRLKKLHGHMVFLSQLAQPRTYGEVETGRGPEINGDELAVCLELLAEQAERVLDEATYPAERVLDDDHPEARDEDEALEVPAQAREALAACAEDDEAGEALTVRTQDDEGDEASGDTLGEDQAAEPDGVATGEQAEAPYVFGMTMDQLDTLNRLHDRLHAFGDLVFGVERIDLAKGTLTMLGDAIFEVSETASDLMCQVNRQMLPDALRSRNRVREERGAYGQHAALDPAFDAAMPMLPPAYAGWHPQVATRH